MRFNTKRPVAVAQLRGGGGMPRLRGTVKFYQMPGGIVVETGIFGLPENSSGFYGIHIHEGAFCTGKGFSDTGGHFDTKKRMHPNHAGDLPVLISCAGRAYSAVLTNRFSIQDILGRTVVIHSDADDYRTQPAGASGDKIACGIIQKYK